MKHLISLLIVFMCIGCESDHISSILSDEIIIYGHQIDDYVADEPSRSASYIEKGSTASFFAQGYMEANGNLLTLQDTYWKLYEPIVFNGNQTQSNITVYCPPLPDMPNSWLQIKNQLPDILISKTSCYTHQPIRLNFSHLFSKIIFRLDKELNAKINTLTCTVCPKITEIEPISTSIKTNCQQNYFCEFKVNQTGTYSMIVPSVNGISIIIKIITNEGIQLEKKLSNLSCEKGTAYSFGIKEKKNTIGIFTADDFIAFTYLINKQNYKNRSLKEFGITRNKVTTYYLRNNIHFTNSQRQQIQQIAHISETQNPNYFNDIFDGTGHYLENLYIKAKYFVNSALFPSLGKTGIIKNLTIKQAESYKDSYNGSIGILCGQSDGIIDNCHVQNSTLYPQKTSSAALCTYNNGLIINSSVNGISFRSTNNDKYDLEFGGLTKHNMGKILNCYTLNVTCANKSQGNNMASTLCQVNNGTISNCYTDWIDRKLSPICCNNNHTLDYCYQLIKNSKVSNRNNDLKKENTPYKENQTRGATTITAANSGVLMSYLNKWITDKAPQLYPNYTFLHWKLAPNSIVTFDNP